jgi:hypothetical protein
VQERRFTDPIHYLWNQNEFKISIINNDNLCELHGMMENKIVSLVLKDR